MNKVILVGRLGGDAELKELSGGTVVASFSVATSESWKDKSGDKQERTEWHRVQLWGKVATALQPYLKKGKQVLVEGKIKTNEVKDAKGEVKRYTNIDAQNVLLLGHPLTDKSDPEVDSWT